MSNNLDNERANRMFTIFCYAVLIALLFGTILGALAAYFILT